MTPEERKIHDAISKLTTPDRPAIVVPIRVEGDRKHLESLIQKAKSKTRTELNLMVKKKHFTRKTANEILTATNAITKIIERPENSCLVAVFPELKDGDLYLHSVAVAV
jgi:hypothetical protein